MSPPIPYGLHPKYPCRPTDAARTLEPEGNPPDAVTAVPAVSDPDPDTTDSDRVQQVADYLAELRAAYITVPLVEMSEEEALRQSRLRRWQAVDPRERRT